MQLFLSHAWGTDDVGRDNHLRVRSIANALRLMGWCVWLDEDCIKAGDDIDSKMTSGILTSDAVCVCCTRKYLEKINTNAKSDNCVKEWKLLHHARMPVVPIVMEPFLLEPNSWPKGICTMYLLNRLFVDFSGDDLSEPCKTITCHLRKLLPMTDLSSSGRIKRGRRGVVERFKL